MTIATTANRLLNIALAPIVLFLNLSFVMFRRFSSFRKGKKDEVQVNGTSSKENGHTKDHIQPPAHQKPTEEFDHSSGRAEIESTLEQFAQLIHAAHRPLPTQTGDGAYLDHEVPTGLMQDLKSLGFRDVKTLMDLMKSKAAGGLQDDKTMIMERVIQVMPHLPLLDRTNAHRLLACKWITQAIKGSCRFDHHFYRRIVGLAGTSTAKLPRKQIPVSSGRWFIQCALQSPSLNY